MSRADGIPLLTVQLNLASDGKRYEKNVAFVSSIHAIYFFRLKNQLRLIGAFGLLREAKAK